MSNDKNLSLKVSKVQRSAAPHAGQQHQAYNKPAADPVIDSIVAEVTHLAHTITQPKDIANTSSFVTSAETTLRNSGRALLLGDIAALALSFLAGGIAAFFIKTYLVQNGFEGAYSFATLKQFLMYMGLGSIALLWLDQKGHYRQRLPFWEVLGHLVSIALVGLVVGGFAQFAMKQEFSRLWLALSWLALSGFLFIGRVLVKRHLRSKNKWNLSVLLLGTGATAQAAKHALKTDGGGMGYWINAEVDPENLQTLTHARDWHNLLAETNTNYIMIALEGSALEEYQPMLKALVRAHVPYTIVPPWLGLPSSDTPHGFFTQDVVMLHNVNRLTLPLPRLMKRTFDILVAGSAVLALSPLFLVLAILVKRDGGPAFLANQRIGHGGKKFGCLKFRSMVLNNDVILQQYLDANPEAAEEWRKFQKLTHDPRITKFGAFIRKTSMDELPQLLNVVKGDMSLVGPRPILPEQADMYGDDYSFYTAVRPGITGPWQVSGRNKLTIAQRVQLEGWYARNWSLWMDIVILLKTVPTVLGRGSKAV